MLPDALSMKNQCNSIKCTFTKFMSCIYVGKPNGRRFIYHGSDDTSCNVSSSSHTNGSLAKNVSLDSKRFELNSSSCLLSSIVFLFYLEM